GQNAVRPGRGGRPRGGRRLRRRRAFGGTGARLLLAPAGKPIGTFRRLGGPAAGTGGVIPSFPRLMAGQNGGSKGRQRFGTGHSTFLRGGRGASPARCRPGLGFRGSRFG